MAGLGGFLAVLFVVVVAVSTAAGLLLGAVIRRFPPYEPYEPFEIERRFPPYDWRDEEALR